MCSFLSHNGIKINANCEKKGFKYQKKINEREIMKKKRKKFNSINLI